MAPESTFHRNSRPSLLALQHACTCVCVRLRSPPSLRLPSSSIPPTLPLSTRCLSQQCAECSIPADLPNYHHRVSARPRPLSACSALNYTPACRACPIPGMPPRAQPGREEPCLGFPQLAKQAPDCTSRKRGGKHKLLRSFLHCAICTQWHDCCDRWIHKINQVSLASKWLRQFDLKKILGTLGEPQL